MITALIAALLLAPAATGTQASLSTTSVMEFASSTAIEDGLDKEHFLATLNCESGFEYDAKGDDGVSIGAAQIDFKYHPEIFYTQALDPRWSILWMAQMWKDGYAHWWSCYNLKAWEYKRFQV